MKKIYVYGLLALIAITTITSCSKKNVSEVKRDGLTIGLCMDDYVQERWKKDKDLFTRYSQELGGEVITEVAQGNPQLQIEQAKNLLDRGADVLVVVPVSAEAAAAIVEAAHDEGVKVIAYDRIIKNCDLDYYISFDNLIVGELQADYISKRVPNGNYIILNGPTYDNNAQLMYAGQMGVLKSAISLGEITLLNDKFVRFWHKEQGYEQIKGLLKENKGTELHAVIAGNDDLAEGVIDALKEKGLEGKVMVAGQDADLEACRRIVSGTQIMTVYKPLEIIAKNAAKAAVAVAKGETFSNTSQSINNGKVMVPAILISPVLVHKDNLKSTVIKDGFHKEEDVYKSSEKTTSEEARKND